MKKTKSVMLGNNERKGKQWVVSKRQWDRRHKAFTVPITTEPCPTLGSPSEKLQSGD
jgi:hypothetical protein